MRILYSKYIPYILKREKASSLWAQESDGPNVSTSIEADRLYVSMSIVSPFQVSLCIQLFSRKEKKCCHILHII
jgi:hypothetical protein